MKKIMAYMTTGILLGITLMLLPGNLSPDRPPGGGFWTTFGVDSTKAQPSLDEKYRGLSGIDQPNNIEVSGLGGIGVLTSSLLYAGLIFVVSLLFALGVYAFFKRRMIA